MAKITARTILDQLRSELQSRGVSLREIERLLGAAFRHKVKEGAERLVSVELLLRVLELAGIEPVLFFARLAGTGELSLAVFGRAKKERWTQSQRRILGRVGEVEERGAAGFLEARAELRRIELLRDEDPRAAEAAAWELLETRRAPGVLVGALAILAVEAPRPNALRLLTLAFELLGADRRSAAGGKLMMAMGRCLASANLHREALQVFEVQALPVVALYGTLEEQAWLTYSIGLCASAAGELETSRAALEKTLAIGSERLRFAALQLMAIHELNCGDLQKAVGMYDDLVAMPYFAHAEKRAKVSVTLSRLTAHFLAGRLEPAAELDFREAVQATRGVLDLRNQVAAVLDLALFLHSIGKYDEAKDLLKAELWNALDLEDAEIQHKLVGMLDAFGVSHQVPRTAAPSHPATRRCLLRLALCPARLSPGPRSRARDPKE